jgi:hypothetical protein
LNYLMSLRKFLVEEVKAKKVEFLVALGGKKP